MCSLAESMETDPDRTRQPTAASAAVATSHVPDVTVQAHRSARASTRQAASRVIAATLASQVMATMDATI